MILPAPLVTCRFGNTPLVSVSTVRQARVLIDANRGDSEACYLLISERYSLTEYFILTEIMARTVPTYILLLNRGMVLRP